MTKIIPAYSKAFHHVVGPDRGAIEKFSSPCLHAQMLGEGGEMVDGSQLL
jgi:hypothetical protein